MDNNALQVLPGSIGKLKMLVYLDMSKNRIETVDMEISGCEALEDLLLSSNMLQQLPDSIGLLKKLTTLKVDDNQLTLLPNTIGKQEKLLSVGSRILTMVILRTSFVIDGDRQPDASLLITPMCKLSFFWSPVLAHNQHGSMHVLSSCHTSERVHTSVLHHLCLWPDFASGRSSPEL
ncbi:PREDICTED: leucine-rich repeat-containing protein 1-like [Galeopterus variegatus]|uniref:Leucine-rich repeat-containing protein 1-like n=1 Tax=Galeopterus variegatus TaxID=482537 RepID=A0ABM0RYA9_GALVR|nr:PREDICTED: leucine-rich repeat-containing protein 1-like [Galeopterus variegatus]